MLKEIVHYPIQIKGRSSSTFFEVKNPFSNQTIAAVASADQSIIQHAIGVACDTYTAVMSKLPAFKKSDILSKTAHLIGQQHEDLAMTITSEGGKPLKDARVEVSRAINTFSIAAREALRMNGEQLAMDQQPGNEGRIGIVLREPIGVVAAITPFNFPINLVAHKLAPAFAAGNTVVLKPSSQTPISSFKLQAILKQAGLPDGALNIVPCNGDTAKALVINPGISMLTFTGSPQVGWQLRSQVSPGTRTILELGGNAGMIVHEDADIEAAAQAACRGGYANAGQTCISVQRIYVQEKVYKQFLDCFVNKVQSLKVGNPLDELVDVGPLINKEAVDKTLRWIDAAIAGGAKLISGGKLLSNNSIEPTVLIDTKPDMLVICQEVFGPVVSVMKYDTIDSAITLLNDRHYGLQAGIYTNNLEIAFKAARMIDVGGVMVNDAPTFRADHMPYGGRRESGIGLEGVAFAIQEMTQPKFVCLNLPSLS